eukprot:scaffold1342_cov204-Pinguiococcus_pyrenoidosus.AAC.8
MQGSSSAAEPPPPPEGPRAPSILLVGKFPLLTRPRRQAEPRQPPQPAQKDLAYCKRHEPKARLLATAADVIAPTRPLQWQRPSALGWRWPAPPPASFKPSRAIAKW